MKPRILVVEDEALLAIEIARALENAGFDVLGPAMDAPSALTLLSAHGCDAAVLDINLRDETSETVALELTARGTPFLTVSSTLPEQRPPAFLTAPALGKPVAPKVVVAAIRKLVTTLSESSIFSG